MNSDTLTLTFLLSYANYLGWEDHPTDIDGIARKLCEEYHYNPDDNKLLLIALGYFAAVLAQEKFPYVDSNCYCAVLKLKMDAAYAVVAKENHWD